MTMLFTDPEHEQRFTKCYIDSRTREPAFLAAIYLLTSDKNLWTRARFCLSTDNIDFSKMILNGMRPDGYVIYSAAKDLFTDTNGLAYSDMFDKQIVNGTALELLINALRIKRNGFRKAIRSERQG